MSQLKHDITEYLLIHKEGLKEYLNKEFKSMNIDIKYEGLRQKQYEQVVLELLKDDLVTGLNIYDLSTLNATITKDFIEDLLGKDFLKYEKL